MEDYKTGDCYEAGLWSRSNIEAFIKDGNSINIPTQQSPAVGISKMESATVSPAVEVPYESGLLPISPHDHPDCQAMIWTYSEIDAIKDYAKRCIAAQSPSPRITEQDAREIAISAVNAYIDDPDTTITWWIENSARALINKLNEANHGS